MKLFDAHAHFDMERQDFASAREAFDRAREAGVKGIIAIAGASSPGVYKPTLDLATGDRGIWTAAGIHPHAASYATPSNLEKLRFALDHATIRALGEIGLDYHYNHSPPADQRRALIRQLRMAHQVGLPIVIHSREAEEDTLAILRDEGAIELGGVIHCFSAREVLAHGALDMGFFISFSGIVTFPAAEEIRQVAAAIPKEYILAETDSPFLSPVPFRGRRNEPGRVLHIVEKLAEIHKVDVEEMASITVENTCRCFRIDRDELE
jgi:TatD DNase family protein